MRRSDPSEPGLTRRAAMALTELGVDAEVGEPASQGPAERAVLDPLRRAG